MGEKARRLLRFREEAREVLTSCAITDDKELAHEIADSVLLGLLKQLGYGDIVALWRIARENWDDVEDNITAAADGEWA